MKTPNNYLDRASGDDDVEYQEEWLSAYLDDELTAAQRTLVEQRLVEDEQAAVMLQDLMRVRSLVGSLPAWTGNSVSLADVTPKLSRPTAMEHLAIADENSNELAGDASNADPQTRRANLQDRSLDNAGDYHNDLNSDTQSRLSSAPIAGVLERDIIPDFSRGRRTSSLARWSNAWLRPAILVACLLLALGLGYMLWPAGSPLSVATNSGARIEPSSSVDKASEDIASAGNSELAMDSDAVAAPSMAAPRMAPPEMAVAEMAAPKMAVAEVVPGQAVPFSADNLAERRGQASENGLGNTATRMEFPGNAALPSSVDPLKASSSLPSTELRKELTESAEESVGQPRMRRKAEDLPGPDAASKSAANSAALLRSPNVDATANPAPLQLARSSAWTEAEIAAGLVRLSPFLNLSSDQQTESSSDQSQRTQGSAGLAQSAGNEYPIAVVTRQRAERGGAQLPALLQQPSYGLTGIPDQSLASKIPGHVPYGADSATAPSTIALFVDRGLAQQILQAAEQAGEVVGKPVWIMSTSNKDTIVDPAQKVVLLISPQ